MVGASVYGCSASAPTRSLGTRLACTHVLLTLVLVLVAASQAVCADGARAPDGVAADAAAGSGSEVRRWRRLMAAVANLDEFTKVIRINEHLNRIAYVEDAVLWGRPDYWATPREFLEHGGGDCEDFSIAKYFLLQELGVPVARLRLVYARILATGESHMVLAYFRADESDPLILDNLTDAIRPLSKRDDLLPYYGFNSHGLWLTVASGRFMPAAMPLHFSQWSDLEGRVDADHSRRL